MTKKYALGAPKPSVRVTLTFVTLLAFIVQNYITQTHIHIPRAIAHLPTAGDIAAKAVASEPVQTSKNGYPANQDPANCPTCQEIMHVGQFVVPAAALLVLPSAIGFGFAVFIETTTYSRAPSHIWHSRAPPAL